MGKLIEKMGSVKFIFLIIIFIVVGGLIYVKNMEKEEVESDLEMEYMEEKKSEENENKIDKKEEEKIYVHIAGEIKNSGVYLMEKGSRIKDIIEIAGGITEKGDLDNINLAEILEDEMKIDIPNKNEKVSEEVSKKEIGKASEKVNSKASTKKIKVNINRATKEELESVTGVGPTTADKIISYRKENGKFKNIEDLKNVKGIGEAKFEKMKGEVEI